MTTAPNEYIRVELPLIQQLKGMGWSHIEGDIDVPYLTERQSFRETLLAERLKQAIHRLNRDDDDQPWLEGRINRAIGDLERLGTAKLMEANQLTTELLLRGTVVEGDLIMHGGRDQTVCFINFEYPERNDFLVINQFRVDTPGGRNYIVPDLVLFVNGIPLVVIEAKSPAITDPIFEAITQLRRYANQRDEIEDDEGAERLFHYNQFLIATCYYEARAGTIAASYEHYLEWKDTSPVPMSQVAADLGITQLTSQQILVAGMLRPTHLLDLVRSFTLFDYSGSKTIKLVARYQQFRAVQEAIRRLQNGQTRQHHGESDQRGGIIWHTQGSGKSLTMVFLARKMRTLPHLRQFKIIVVTDRKDLERQLSQTASLTGETLLKATRTEALRDLLRETIPALVFAMIQKYQQRDEDALEEMTRVERAQDRTPQAAEPSATYRISNLKLVETELFPVLNESEDILVLIDEGHRSQSSQLHANLLRALPNCARIAFTGTPILDGDRKRTSEIFGGFIDRYTIQESEADGATVPIFYEGRTAEGEVADGRSLDQLFEDMFQERSPEDLAAIRTKYATESNVLEAPKLITAKADDMLRHYISTVLPNGFKAQVVASSRLATVRYQSAFVAAHQVLIHQLEALDSVLLTLTPDELEQQPENTQFLVRAYPRLDIIRRLEFAAIISGSHNDDPAWARWSDKSRVDGYIDRFKKPLLHTDPTKQDGMAFLIVKSMLLTGFDAPIEQVLYLDRLMQSYELLQAIARVNRTHPGKPCGYVMDYYGVARHLKEALAVYSAEDIQGALTMPDR